MSKAEQLKELVDNGNMLMAQSFVIANRVCVEFCENTSYSTYIFDDGTHAAQTSGGVWLF